MFYYDSSVLAKSSVRYYPGIGKIAECIQTVFINRADTKEKKAEYMKIIQDRQVQAETGEIPPIIIYPEEDESEITMFEYLSFPCEVSTSLCFSIVDLL